KIDRGEIEAFTPEDSAALIPDTNTALLEFVVMEDKTDLFVLTKNGAATQAAPDMKLYRLEVKQKDLARLTRQFRQGLRDYSFLEVAPQLYDMLLKPARALLQKRTNLIIVPDGVLWELPFQALMPGQGHFLIEDCAISYAPSLSVLQQMVKLRRKPERRSSPTTPTLLAFGNPVIGKETAGRIRSVFTEEALPPLPEAEREVKALGGLYGAAGSRVYIGREAREDRLKEEAGRYDVLQLATHGLLNNASPMYSQLVLSQTPGSEREDGLLEAWEIMKLELKAEIVVLSACETGRGRVGAGEGIIGLSWALFVAGSPTTVVSQWSVESASTAEMMVEFHRRLRSRGSRGSKGNGGREMSKAEALRQAELRLLKSGQYQNPFYWAGFVMVGDGR
ncbi:MAG: CHAT domain-containing protein, partial [Pyrinomonadaceae bacterium]